MEELLFRLKRWWPLILAILLVAATAAVVGIKEAMPGIRAGEAPLPMTVYAADYTWRGFDQIEVGDSLAWVHELVGKPLWARDDNPSKQTLCYSAPNSSWVSITDNFHLRLLTYDPITDRVLSKSAAIHWD